MIMQKAPTYLNSHRTSDSKVTIAAINFEENIDTV
jgi:hypothetical protein